MNHEQEMIRRCIRGEKKALTELYDLHAPVLLGVCLRYVPSREDAEDILQEAFIRILRSLGRFEYRGDGSFKGWMRRVVVNLSLNYLRKKDNKLLISGSDHLHEVELTPDEDPPHYEISPEDLNRLIANLPPGYRTVLNLYVFENFSHREIADALGCSESNSRSQLLRARTLLKKNMMDFLTNPKDTPAYGR